jgi:hypothetical protein
MNADWIPAWKRSSAAFALSTFGLGALCLLTLGLAFVPAFKSFSLVPIVISAIGLCIAGVGFHAWASTGWVRRLVAHGRSEGKAIWPIRTESGRRTRVFPGILEVSENGLSITLQRGVVSVDWADITRADALDRGPISGGCLVVEGVRLGRAELEVLQPNAAAQVSDDELRECVEIIQRLRAG